MYIKEQLPNGIRVVTEEIPHVRSVSIGLWVGVGSRDETDENSGIAHFIEHMMFKGTKNRSAKQIAEELDAIGGQLNAFTAKEYTCYYAKTLDEHFPKSLNLLADMFFNSLYDPQEIDKERNVIIEEINMYEDAPDELIHDLFASTLWNNHPLGRSIIGTREVVEKINRADIISFLKTFYTPDQLVIAVAGNVKHDRVMELITPLFDRMEGKSTARNYAKPVPVYQVATKKKDTEQVHLCIGVPGLPLDHEQIYSLYVLNSILGGGISSRLFQEIREERGLAYSVYSYHNSYKDAGLFSIYTGLSLKNIGPVVELISRELKQIKAGKVTEEEVFRAKEQLKGSLYLGLENVSNRMSRIGKSELCLGRIITPEEAVEKINRVGIKDVQLLAEQLFASDKMVLTSIGPMDHKIDIVL
ncbi:peptidase M16 domain-containing protein [Thermincola ferriacetica]|uniref:Peptidase M16 domain-containing protein n=1 Tax=Thermincola ferriacetica TaxID=281456 RepID=A0A0L6W171_9FIRM|nr:pitrilysin family protein [Thermincola ferriacetica]KNZ69322.1 peptidase M16 domain-containing protein [Thermincola ferriacetica]